MAVLQTAIKLQGRFPLASDKGPPWHVPGPGLSLPSAVTMRIATFGMGWVVPNDVDVMFPTMALGTTSPSPALNVVEPTGPKFTLTPPVPSKLVWKRVSLKVTPPWAETAVTVVPRNPTFCGRDSGKKEVLASPFASVVAFGLPTTAIAGPVTVKVTSWF